MRHAWVVLPAFFGCVAGGGDFTIRIDEKESKIRFNGDGDDVVMDVDASLVVHGWGEGVVRIESAEVVAQVDGEAIVYDAPAISTDEFPLASDPFRASFAVPSPIDDIDELEARCSENGRFVDLTVHFTRSDEELTATARLPLVYTQETPRLPVVFGSPGVLTLDGRSDLAPPRISRGSGDEVLITIEDAAGGLVSPGQYRFWRADRDSWKYLNLSAAEFAEQPRASAGGDGVILAARSAVDSRKIAVLELDEDGWLQATAEISADLTLDTPPGERLQIAYLTPSPNGSYVAVRSAFSLLGPAGSVAPVAGKAHGSFLFEISHDLAVLSASSLERDLVFIESTADGGTLLATTPLPPQLDGEMLEIERRDSTGATLWRFEHAVPANEPIVRPLEDGGAVVALDNDGEIEVVRIGPDGSEGYRFTAVGTHPSVAVNAQGLAVLSFVGNVPGFDLPSRSVPLLIELSDEGTPLRAAQVACSGFGVIGNDSADGVVLVGTFEDRMSIGDHLVLVDPRATVVTAVE